MLDPLTEIAKFQSQKDRAVNKTLMLVVCPLPGKGISIFDYGVGVDCLFLR